MPIQFKCNQCGRKLQAPDSAAGRRAKCPDCGTVMTIPGDVYDAEEVAVAEEVIPATRQEGEGAYGLAEPAPRREEADRTPCAMCGELIPAGAAKCRYCGEIFDPALKRIEEKKRRHADGDSNLTVGEWVAAILCSGIACIIGVVWMIQGKPKGWKMFLVALAADLVKSTIWVLANLATGKL